MDISEQCGYTIAQQAALFHSIKPLFSNKPLMVVANKTDVTPLSSLPASDTALLAEMVQAAAVASNGGVYTCLITFAGQTDDRPTIVAAKCKRAKPVCIDDMAAFTSDTCARVFCCWLTNQCSKNMYKQVTKPFATAVMRCVCTLAEFVMTWMRVLMCICLRRFC